MKVDLSNVRNIDVGGKGGQETLISSLFPGSVRKSSPLYDFDQNGILFEVKKQQNLQWFDIGKYANLSDKDRKIVMVFVIHDKGKVIQITSINLGEFINILINDDEYAKDGWTDEGLKETGNMKIKYPKLQTKAGLKIKNFIQKYSKNFQFIYE